MKLLLTIIFYLLTFNFNKEVEGIFVCDNKLKTEEIKIKDGQFVLAHISHIDGCYVRKGKVITSSDTIRLVETTNLEQRNLMMPFYDKFIFKDKHLFVLFKDKKGKEYIKKSRWNFSPSNNEILLNQDWTKE